MKQIKCAVGNKPCGKRCIPVKWKCRDEEQKRPNTINKTAITTIAGIFLGAGVITYFGFKFIKPSNILPVPGKGEYALLYFKIDENNLQKANILKEAVDKVDSVVNESSSAGEKVDSLLEPIKQASTLHSIKDIESKFDIKIDPAVRSKLDENEQLIMLIDGESKAWKKLSNTNGNGARAVYHPYLKKVIIPDTFKNIDLSEEPGNSPSVIVSHELIHLNQYRGNWHYTDEEYLEKIKDLTPTQFYHLHAVNKEYKSAWDKMFLVYKKLLGAEVDRSTFQRTEFEAYLATTDWDAIEENKKKF